MKLDKELVREVLLAIESSDHDPDDSIEVTVEGRSGREVSYHLMLLHEAGLVLGEDLSGIGEELAWEAYRLTYAGHDFLDTIRDGEVWRRTKEGAGKVGGGGPEDPAGAGQGLRQAGRSGAPRPRPGLRLLEKVGGGRRLRFRNRLRPLSRV